MEGICAPEWLRGAALPTQLRMLTLNIYMRKREPNLYFKPLWFF